MEATLNPKSIPEKKFNLRRTVRRLPSLAILALYAIFCLFPIFWIIVTSFKTPNDINTYPPLFTFKATLENYRYLIDSHDFVNNLTNSVIISVSSTVFVMLLGIPTSYALAKYKVGGKFLSEWILSMRMFPPIAMVVPLFMLFRMINLIHTHAALIIMYTAMNLPFAIWLMSGFFADIPREIDDAALVDGCNVWQSLWQVNVPAIAPGLVAAAILSIIFAWNEFLFAVIIAGGQAKTLPVAAAGFITDRAIFWGPMSAASVVALVPILIFALFVQRYLVRGLTLGAVQ